MSTSIYFRRITAVFLFLMLSTVGIAHAVTNGQPDEGAHPYVAVIIFGAIDEDDESFVPQWWCSGTLIAPTVLLTAGSCTSNLYSGELPDEARVWFEEAPTSGNWVIGETCKNYTDFPCTGNDAAAENNESEENIITHPDYRASDFEPPYGGRFSRDVGVLLLDTPIYLDEYALLPFSDQSDDLMGIVDVGLVGYGNTYQAQIPGNLLSEPPPVYPLPYYRWAGGFNRYYAPAQIIPGQFEWSDDKMRISANPGGENGGFCFGDAGGPVLKEVNGEDYVLAVFSYMENYNCAGQNYSSRVDIPDVLEWIIDILNNI